MSTPRWAQPARNPAGLAAAGLACYAAGVMIYNAVRHQGLIDPQVIVAAIAALAALGTRQLVTPVADPRGAGGEPLAPAASPAAGAAGERMAP